MNYHTLDVNEISNNVSNLESSADACIQLGYISLAIEVGRMLEDIVYGY